MKIKYLVVMFLLSLSALDNLTIIDTTSADEKLPLVKKLDNNSMQSRKNVTKVIEVRNYIAYLPNETEPFTGVYEENNPSGGKAEANFLAGLRNGVQTLWNQNGKIISEENYKNGKQDGSYTIWDDSGNKFHETSYKDGLKDGVEITYENGRKLIETNYKDGKPSGIASYWRADGTKRAEMLYSNGKQIGTTILFDENGNKIESKNKDSQQTSPIVQDIINRCRTQMGEYGAAKVKACVDQDIEALDAIASYVYDHFDIVKRCNTQMKEHGYSKIKACIVQDIAAEDALKKY